MDETGIPRPAGLGGIPPGGLPSGQGINSMHQVNLSFPAHITPQAPPPIQPSPLAAAPSPVQKKQISPEKAEPWKYLPPDKCPYRADGKCIGAEACLYKMDTWGQQRAMTKFQFSERYGSPKSPKEAHIFYMGRKTSQLEEADDRKLDLWIRKSRECAFHKTLDVWDDTGFDDGDEPTSWARLI